MTWGVLAAAVVPALIAWSVAFLAWRWACRRLGLRGPDPAGAGERERAARRSLRALLAFELFVVYPGLFLVGSTLLVVSAGAGSTRLLPDLALVVLVAGASTIPLASAAADVREHARRRRAGAPGGTPAAP